MEALIHQYGRPRIWAAILVSLVLIIVLIGAAWSSYGPEPIGAAEALEHGGHLVIVTTNCPEDRGGTYEVITQAGRPPARSSGELSGNQAEVVVGPDWIGNIRIEDSWGSPPDWALSGTIGGPFGWEPRHVSLQYCQRPVTN